MASIPHEVEEKKDCLCFCFFYLIHFDSDISLKESNMVTFPCGTQCHISSLRSVSDKSDKALLWPQGDSRNSRVNKKAMTVSVSDN